MMLRRNTPATGICFAWWPVQTPEGKIWLEHVHYEWIDHGFGGWRYARMVSDEAYQRGERAQSSFKAYATPPGDPRVFCRNYRPDGPTPCHYPHCLVGGMDNCEVCIGRDTGEN